MSIKKLILLIILTLILLKPAHAFVIINEIYADPAGDLTGDANNDGVRSATQDEFVELLNDSSNAIDISGWKINDASSLRHVFSPNTTLLPYEYIVVFGGGDPNLYDIKWQKASTGALNLNNTNETVTLFNSNLQMVDQVSYTTLANNDQSIVRNPENASGIFVLHTVAASDSADLFSPGTNIDGESFSQVVTASQVITTPELPAYVYFLIALVGWASMNISTGASLRTRNSCHPEPIWVKDLSEILPLHYAQGQNDDGKFVATLPPTLGKSSCLRLSRLVTLTIENSIVYFNHSNFTEHKGRTEHA